MSRTLRRVAVLAAVLAVVLLLRFTVFRPAPVPVAVYAIDRGRVEETVVNTRAGTVESRRRSRMSPGLAGLVAEIPVEKGDHVKAGEVLLRLEDSEHRAAVNLAARSLDAARAGQAEACSTAAQAARDLRRSRELAGRKLVSDSALEEATTRANVSEAGCTAARERARQAQASLESARATLAKTVIVAPFDGVVLDVDTDVGEWISPSPPGVFIPPVVDVIDPRSLYVEAPMDEVDVARLAVGLPVRVTLDAFPGRDFPGTLTYVASFVETREQQNRTVDVEAELNDEELPPNLLAGLSADVEVILDARDDALRVPSYALLEGDRVLVLREGHLHEAAVETGLRNWEFTEVRSGLAEGDSVVVSLDRPEVRAGARARAEAGAGT
jgi:HlyD family secretion protein